MRPQYLGVVTVLCLASRALGDGCYIPERAVRKIPEIPAQRALLSWEDGRETLVISSALDSEAQKLGWLIPIPAVPELIEKESPGALKTLNFCIQPKITHDLYRALYRVVLAMLLGNLLLATWLFKRKHFLTLLLLVLVVFVLLSLMAHAGGTGNAVTKVLSVSVEKSATVGSYDVSILRPSKCEDLNAWLVENGFSSLPATANAMITDYLAESWVFAAIKLVRAESGANAPHPIKMVFTAKEAVYPMRLTAIAGGSTRFEIFVIANDRASCDELEEEFCDRFSKIEHKGWNNDEAEDVFVGMDTKQKIGHPGICSSTWDNCVLTKFAGTISADDMTRDIQFNWKPFQAYQQHFYTVTGARDLALIFVVWLLGGWGFVSMLVCRQRIVQPRGLRWYFGKVFLPAIALVALGAGILFASVPKLNASEVQVSRGLWRQRLFPIHLRTSIESLLKDHPDVLRKSDQEIADYLLKNLGESAMDKAAMGNAVVGTRLMVEDSPGNFTVEKQRDKVIVRVYDLIGMALVTEYPIPGGVGSRNGDAAKSKRKSKRSRNESKRGRS